MILGACALLLANVVVWPAEGVRVAGECGGTVDFVNDGRVANVRTEPDLPWPGITFRLDEPIDISTTNCLLVAVSNRTDRQLRLFCDAAAKSGGSALRGETTLAPRARGVIAVRNLPKCRPVPVKLDRMEGYFEKGANSLIYPENLDQVRVISICSSRTSEPKEFSVFRLVTRPVPQVPFKGLAAEGFFPFVDEYGQFRHDDWPGKVHSAEDLSAARDEEKRELAAHPECAIPDADRFGGWAKGPQLKATGSFRTEKVNGRWWLVDPDGHLFFSQGVNSVGVTSGTSFTGRENYFEKIPPKDDPVFGRCHYADGRFGYYGFARANMIRKYGADWEKAWPETTQRRLRSWGLNTLGNWSDARLFRTPRVPYTVWVHLWCANVVKVEGRTFPDVFSDEFRARLASEAERVASDVNSPWCIGLFVDNEIGWGHGEKSLAVAAANAPDGSAAKEEYKRWTKANPEAGDEGFHAYMAETYFRLTREAMKRAFPDKLYISCRFAFGGTVVNRLAAKYCDIVSWNLYRESPVMELPSGAEDKPILVGEFHFGALDRGLLHTGIVPAFDQRDRAEKYKRYVRLALASDKIVGVHWFAWRDQLVSGRNATDGENFQDGFVDVTDRPYSEMVEAARTLARELYKGAR